MILFDWLIKETNQAESWFGHENENCIKQSNFILSWLHSGNHYQPVDHENVEKCDKKTFGLCSGIVSNR